MPQELTPEQRLTQIEQILKSAVKLSHSNTAKIDAKTELIKANQELIKANAEAIALQDQKIDRLTEQERSKKDRPKFFKELKLFVLFRIKAHSYHSLKINFY